MPKSKKENIEEITLDPIEEKVKEPAPVEEPVEEPVEPETVEAGEDINEPEFEEPVEGEEGEDAEFDEDAGEETDEDAPEEDAPPFLGLMLGAKNAPVSEDPDPQSRIEALLWHIINGTTTDAVPQSRNEAILTAIANSGTYSAEAQSRIEALLIAILNHEEVNITPISRNEAILKAIANSGEYGEEPQSRNEELLLKWLEAWGVVIDTASGAIANFTTSLALPLVSVKSAIVATGGGGTPANPIAINGFSNAVIRRSGANLFDEVMELGVLDNNGNIQSSSTNLVSTNKFAIKGGATLYFSCVKKTSTNQCYGVAFYDKDENFISGSGSIVQTNTFTPPQNACFMRFFVPLSWYVSSTYENDISINGVSTDTAYHAYNPNSTTLTLALGQTVYGGEVDATNGKVKITHEIVDLGDLTYTHTVWGAGYVFSVSLPLAKEQAVASQKGNIVSTIYNNITSTDMYNSNPNYSMCLNRQVLRISNSDYSDKDIFKTAMSGQKLVYELAEPIEIDITPQEITALVGVNNLWSDTGDSTVEYKKKQTD